MILFWLLICLIMGLSVGVGFYIGALFEKGKLKNCRMDDAKTRAYHLGNDVPVTKGKCKTEPQKPTSSQPSDVLKNMKGQDKKYRRLKSTAKE